MRWEGVSDGLKVTAGSVIQRDDLVQYTATADATSSGGVLRVPIACSSAGAVGNADDGIAFCYGLVFSPRHFSIFISAYQENLQYENITCITRAGDQFSPVSC